MRATYKIKTGKNTQQNKTMVPEPATRLCRHAVPEVVDVTLQLWWCKATFRQRLKVLNSDLILIGSQGTLSRG